ncbi:MAG: 50S ribosomal protein L10 [Candidatus Omnitrophica bacterium CG23_combo_of_CG06-09_8_20_14_all_40_11]|nr:MAG: 50S ribosomal protein L10 [Candidatus Omnitrophica bacterium CG23_combo_of_CG06-09_8_20_14_all_40_11]
MKKLGSLFRETLENNIKKQLKESDSIFIIRYSKLSSPDLTTLRQSLRGTNATLFVAKNSITRRALADAKLEDLIKFVEGPCGLVFAKGEAVDATRALYNFYRKHEQLKLECGLLKDRFLDKKDIETLACLPGKEVLRAQFVMTLNSPISGFVRVLKQTLTKFVYCLDQIKNKKGN